MSQNHLLRISRPKPSSGIQHSFKTSTDYEIESITNAHMVSKAIVTAHDFGLLNVHDQPRPYGAAKTGATAWSCLLTTWACARATCCWCAAPTQRVERAHIAKRRGPQSMFEVGLRLTEQVPKVSPHGLDAVRDLAGSLSVSNPFAWPNAANAYAWLASWAAARRWATRPDAPPAQRPPPQRLR
jgi:hypothetical protein